MPPEVFEAGQGILSDLKRASPCGTSEHLLGWWEKRHVLCGYSPSTADMDIHRCVGIPEKLLRTATWLSSKGERVVEVEQGVYYVHQRLRSHSPPHLQRAGTRVILACEMKIEQIERDRHCLSTRQTPWIPWTVPFSHRIGLMMCIIAAGWPGVCQRFLPEWDGISQPGRGGGD